MQVELAVQTHLEMQVELAAQAQLEAEVQPRVTGPGAGLLLRDECDLVNLPAADRMRDREVHIGISRWIIYPRMERPMWLEEL